LPLPFWGSVLKTLVNVVSALPVYPLISPIPNYRSWVRAESV
jgi:hypothetical protein